MDETGFIKKEYKYLNYLYKEKVIWGTNTKKHEEKRREEPKHDKRRHKIREKRAGSAKDDTHPYYYKVLDISTDAEKKMKEINKAHGVISDPAKRARHDNFENTFKD